TYDVSPIDDRLGRGGAFDHSLRLVPFVLSDHVRNVEPALGIDIGQAACGVRGRLPRALGDDRQHLRGGRTVMPVAILNESGVVVAVSLFQAAQEAPHGVAALVRSLARCECTGQLVGCLVAHIADELGFAARENSAGKTPRRAARIGLTADERCFRRRYRLQRQDTNRFEVEAIFLGREPIWDTAKLWPGMSLSDRSPALQALLDARNAWL